MGPSSGSLQLQLPSRRNTQQLALVFHPAGAAVVARTFASLILNTKALMLPWPVAVTAYAVADAPVHDTLNASLPAA